MRQKRKIEIPHTMVLLTTCVILVAILTYILPAGVYDRVVNAVGKTVVDPNTYHTIEQTPTTFTQLLTAIPKGMIAAASIVALTLFSGGCIMILRRVGIIDAAIDAFAYKIEGHGVLAIPILMTIFALIDSFIGTPELCMVYIPIVMPLMIRLGFDSLTAMATVVLGSATGFTAGLANPFTIAVGQKLCGLPLYSGWQFRIVSFVSFLVVGAAYIIHHGLKVLRNPQASSMYLEDEAKRARYCNRQDDRELKLSFRKKIASIYVVVLFVLMLVGILMLHWDLEEMTGMFIIIGVGGGVIGGMKTREICVSMADGCRDVMMGALFISIARATAIVMQEGNIVDTIVYYSAKFITSMPSQFVIIGILCIVTLLNFFVSSGSGKAVMLFPILSPLASICGVTQQTAVVAYQFGDGLTNMFWPTNGVQGACLGIAGIPWNKWARFYTPLLITWYVLAIAFLFLAQFIQLGPF